MNIGETIVELRTADGMSQQTLADLLFVSRDLVSKWEKGTRRPDYRAVERIAEIFGVSADSIIDKGALIQKELADCFPEGVELSGEQLAGLLNSFLRGLSPRNADVFLQRYYFQRSVSEIHSQYGIGENHVRSILSKTRKRLRKAIEEGQPWKK